MGVDFGPYLARVQHDIKMNWYKVVPEEAQPPVKKKGKVAIVFAILRDGRLRGMQIEAGGSSGDVALDRAAWAGVTASAPFPPLPPEFRGEYLALRLHFYYNPDPRESYASTMSPSSSRTAVQIVPVGSTKVSVGGSQIIVVTVTGTNNHTVKWSISGEGCSGAGCGTIQGDLYVAPKVLPSKPSISLTATSAEDPFASDSIFLN